MLVSKFIQNNYIVLGIDSVWTSNMCNYDVVGCHIKVDTNGLFGLREREGSRVE